MAKKNINFEVYIVYLDRNICDGCKMCIYMCPCDVFHFSIKASVVNLTNCLGCRTCEAVCKSKAIVITEI